jgi:hypothetical protein
MVARAAALCLHVDVALILFRGVTPMPFVSIQILNIDSGLSDTHLSYETDTSQRYHPIW